MMADVYRLQPALQYYDWGMLYSLEQLIGLPVSGRPVAEAWWGAHASSPAVATAMHAWDRDRVGLMPGDTIELDTLIARDPAAMLGPVARRWEYLPYLLKVLAIAKPLSLQVHPTLAQAEEGYARDDQRGVPLGDASRTFKDRSHKPEMIVAITPMTLLAGFRPTKEVARDLVCLGVEPARRWAADLVGATEPADALKGYLARVLTEPDALEAVDALAEVGTRPGASESLRVAAATLRSFPRDPGALVAIALNVIHLSRGEACFTSAGVIHSYQTGIGVEVMANSDNVVRAGLTPKHVDVPLLVDLAAGTTLPPPVVEHQVDGAVTRYPAPVDEFALSVVDHGDAIFAPGPRIVLAVEGSARVRAGDTGLGLTRGQAAFVPYCDGELAVAASGTTVVAEVPPS